MNILILNWRDLKHPLAGGAEISLYEQAKIWQKKGARITWFSAAFPGALEQEEIDGIKYIRKGNHYTAHLWAFIYQMLGKLPKVDIVVDSFHFVPFFSPLYMRVPVIGLINEVAKDTWFKNISFPFSFIGYAVEPLFFFIYKRSKFITGSNSCKDDLLQMGIKADNITVVPHGIRVIKNDKKKEDAPTVVFLSRISKDKGIEDAVRAIALVKEKIPSIKFWIVGKPENDSYLATIKNIINKLYIGGNSKIFGFISEQEKFALLKKAWILVHPSIREGWGLNVIEANAMGTPAVGYNVSGLKDSIQNGKTGVLTETNFESLAKGIESLILDKKLYGQMSQAAIKWSEGFNWEKAGEASYSILKESYERATKKI
jgi:glycosyltransferase involved in cell wall biosynthesis